MSKIQWTEKTWNPITGCSPISEGCLNCYAKPITERFKKVIPKFSNGFNVTIHRECFNLPKKWKKGKLIFVNSMFDFFHEKINNEVIIELIEIMKSCPQHIFQILTKRPKRIFEFKNLLYADNIMAGVSVETSEYINRIELLVDAKLKKIIKHIFVSFEPLIGKIVGLKDLLKEIDWVIVGPETGPKARNCLWDWVDEIKEHCKKYNVSFMLKTWDTRIIGSPYFQFPEFMNLANNKIVKAYYIGLNSKGVSDFREGKYKKGGIGNPPVNPKPNIKVSGQG